LLYYFHFQKFKKIVSGNRFSGIFY